MTRQLMLSFNQMQSQMQSQIQLQGLVPPPEPEVSPSAACVDPSRKDPNTGASDRRGLYVNENSPCLVAIARVYVGSTTVHNVPLGNDQVKVGVEEI